MQKILYVEDNDDNIYMLKLRLGRKGFDFLFAKDGQQGIDLALSELPDLIIMDISLPKIDGYEATRTLKANPKTKHIPIIILTAHALGMNKNLAFEAGADEYETKPVNMDNLLQKITTLLARSSPPPAP